MKLEINRQDFLWLSQQPMLILYWNLLIKRILRILKKALAPSYSPASNPGIRFRLWEISWNNL